MAAFTLPQAGASPVPFDPHTERITWFDLSGDNPEPDADTVADTVRFSNWVDAELTLAGARYGLGGYDENRRIYGRSTLFDVDEEPRRLHLGLDIWGAAETPVFAPWDGEVHSFAFNDHFGDYGATLILKHAIAGENFFSLYGHLSLESIRDKKAGQHFSAADPIAFFGIPDENGHWPPHLHFQIILDMQGRSGDYPGVCRYSEKEQWLANSPDPWPAISHWFK